jgi:hypothetical protein
VPATRFGVACVPPATLSATETKTVDVPEEKILPPTLISVPVVTVPPKVIVALFALKDPAPEEL